MSAGIKLPHDQTVHNSLGLLAPAMRASLEAGLAECERLALNVKVYETYRTNELQRIYYARGRTVIPPKTIVTRAKDNLSSWHGHGLAIDIIHRVKLWDIPTAWFAAVNSVLKRYDLSWGGDWLDKDLPHWQWHLCPKSPTDEDKALLTGNGGIESVWRKYKAA